MSPADVPDAAPLDVVADAYYAHLFAAALAVDGRTALPPATVARHALSALSLAAAIVAGFLVDRGRSVWSALRNGATLDQVAAACGEPADVVAAELVAWADSRLAEGHLSDAEHAEVTALLPAGTGPVPGSTTSGGLVVEVDRGSTSARGRAADRAWLVRLRRGHRGVVLATGLTRDGAEAFAGTVRALVDGRDR